MSVVEPETLDTASVNRAFTKQSHTYDATEGQNQILSDMRRQVYLHVSEFMKDTCSILELNAGTGIDALYFAQRRHPVLATDLSDGMIQQIEKKVTIYGIGNLLTFKQLSYDRLDQLAGRKFDYIFSNFGGLNCIDDLTKVTRHLPAILNPGGLITWVVMPPVSLWELILIFKGRRQHAFRRLQRRGVTAHIKGEYFKTFYHPLSTIKAAFGPKFKFIKSEGLCALSPPPSYNDFPIKHPGLYKLFRKLDSGVRSTIPFNRWADHLIVTFQLK